MRNPGSYSWTGIPRGCVHFFSGCSVGCWGSLSPTIEIENGEVKDIVADTEPEEEGAAEEVAEESSEEPSEEETPAEEELSEEEQFQKELDDAYARMKEKRY